MEHLYINDVTTDEDVASVSLTWLSDAPYIAYRVFSRLAQEGIVVDIILLSVNSKDIKNICFTVLRKDLEKSTRLLERHKDTIGFSRLIVDDDVAKLSVSGAGMACSSGIASMLFEALYDCGVNIHAISTTEIKIIVLVDKAAIGIALDAVKNKFF